MMKKHKFFKLLVLLFIPLTLLLIGRSLLTGVGVAQENSQVQSKSQAAVLNIGEIYIPCENPSSPICVPYPADVTQHPLPGQEHHELGLWAETFLLRRWAHVYFSTK